MTEEERVRRHAREATLAVVVLSQRTRRKLDAETRAATDQAAGAVERQRGAGGDLRRGVVLAAVIAASGRLAGSYQRVLAEARTGARFVGVERLSIELDSLGLPESDLTQGIAGRMEEDSALALVAGQSLAAQWMGAAAHEAQVAARLGRSVPRALDAARRALAPRAERTAVTEVSRAFSEERRLAFREAVERDREFGSVVRGRELGRRWDAQLEACRECDARDGEVVGIDEDFPDAEPGYMHVRCACIDTVVEL